MNNGEKEIKINKKYEIITNGENIGRIRALRDFECRAKDEIGGFIDNEANLSHEGDAWVSDNAWVSGNARVTDNAQVYGNALVYENAKVYGNAKVSGTAEVYGDLWVKSGSIKKPIPVTNINYIASALDIYPENNLYTLYKRVNKIHEGVYCSIHVENFIYRDNTYIEVNDVDPDAGNSCTTGIHASTPFYWSEGDTLIQVKVNIEDIITCLEGKIRCTRVFVVGEIKNDTI